MKSRWITHEGKRIFYSDCTDIKLADLDQLKAELDEMVAVLAQEPGASVLVITDVRRSVGSPAAVELLKTRESAAAKYILRNAVIGITGIKKILFDAVIRASGQNARAFSDLEIDQAKHWLVEED